MNSTPSDEVSLSEVVTSVKSWFQYLVSKWLLFLIVGILGGLLGIFYAWSQKPIYTAELTFGTENDNASRMGSYAGLAAQFGLDLGSGSGSVFEGDNLMQLLKSRLLVERTMLTNVLIDGKEQLLVDYYIKTNKLDKDWKDDPRLSKVTFSAQQPQGIRARDSIMKRICKGIEQGSLFVDKLDKRLSFISVKMKDEDELFAKLFVEALVNNAIQYYIDYRVKKSRQNVQILQKQTDSVKSLLTGNIVSVAASNDLNVNPLRQMARTNVQRKQVDVQVNSQVYGELLKQLEFSKISLRKETPLIQIIDRPVLPLEKKKLGRLMGAIIFGFVAGFCLFLFLVFKRILRKRG